MKTFLFFLFTVVFATNSMAQDSWSITHNGKAKLKAAGEDVQKNVIAINKADLKKAGSLVVTYSENEKQKGWERSIILFDEKDNELARGAGTSFKLPNSRLASLSQSVTTLKVYTWALPTDPKIAATIRIRRIHLCTIVIK